MPFWRREALHEKLMREAGLSPPSAESSDVSGRLGFFDEVGVTGLHRLREWDAAVAVEAPELQGEDVEFVVLPDGAVLVDEEQGQASLAPLADALEEQLGPPYRARGVRRRGDVWAVGAKHIEVVELQPDVDGEELELVSRAGERALTVDGQRAFGTVPQLERLAQGRSDDYVAHASRLDGSLWEVRIDPL